VSAAVIAGTGAALAAIPRHGTEVFHGCYSKTTGALRLIDPSAGQHCAPDELAVSWNQAGPTGATGATGPTITAAGTYLAVVFVVLENPSSSTISGGCSGGGEVIGHFSDVAPGGSTAIMVFGFISYEASNLPVAPTMTCEDTSGNPVPVSPATTWQVAPAQISA
jgi:hypothetical protein